MKRILLVFCILLYGLSSMATHLAGGIITYECVGNGQYIIKMTRYRDQGGAVLPNTYTVRLNPINGSSMDVTLTRQSSSQVPIVQTNPCHTPNNSLPLDEVIYESSPITLPTGSPIDVYDVTVQGTPPNTSLQPGDCCRNAAVDNIVDPESVGQTLYARFPDPAVYPCNSSPTYKNLPPIEVCLNDTIQFDHSAIDPDGDSLAYSLCDALDNSSYSPPGIPPFASVPYETGFSGNDPIPANPKLSVDPVTGMMTGYPTQVGIYVVNVCMKEYKNGTMIGHYAREIEMSVTNCTPNTQADVETDSTASGGSMGIILECVDSTINFNNQSENAQIYHWDFGLPGNSDTSSKENPTFTYPGPGDYVVTLIANPGYWCADTLQVLARVAAKPEADFAYTEPLCTQKTISFNDQSTISYGSIALRTWELGPGVIKFGKSPKHVYNSEGVKEATLTVDAMSGCSDTIQKSLFLEETPKVSFSPSPIFMCKGDSVELNFNTSAQDLESYSWTPKSNISCDTCRITTVYPTKNKAYVVRVTDSAGCESAPTPISLNVSDPPVVDAGPDTNLCEAGAVTLEASASGFNYQPFYSWSPSNGLSDTSILQPNAFPSQNTTYTLTFTNSQGYCEVSDTVFVRANPTTLSATTQDYKICPGVNADLQSSTNGNQVSYEWEPANLVSDPNIPNPQALNSSDQIFTLTIYDSISTCYSQDTVGVSYYDLQGVDAGKDTTICANDQITLDANKGSNYTWSGGSTLSCTNCETPFVSPTDTTKYFLEGYDGNGCLNFDTVTVNVAPLPNVVVNSDTSICVNSSIELSASGGENYVWAPTGDLSCDSCANPVASPTGNTTYNVTAYSANGCANTASVDVDLISLPNITAPSVGDICEGDSVQLNASGGVVYSWTPASNITNPNIKDPYVFPSISTTYTVEGVDANGCANTAEVFVKVNSLNSSGGTFISDTAICTGDSIELFADGFMNYSWSPGSSLSCTGCSNPIAKPSNTTRYKVEVEDVNGCTDTGSVQIVVNNLPTVGAFAQEDTICEGENTTLNASGGANFVWSPALGLSDDSIQSPVASPGSSTEYTVTVTDLNECSNTATVPLEVEQVPNTNTQADQEICFGDTVSIAATGADSYQWSGQGIIECGSCDTVVVSPDNSNTYTVTGYLNNGCSTTAKHTVTVNPLPANVSISADTTICQGDQASLNVGGGADYNWTPSNTLSCRDCENPIASPSTPTEYTVRIFTNNGCYLDTTTTVTVSSPATVEVTPDTGVCSGGSLQLLAEGGETYEWTPNIEIENPETNSPIVTPTDARSYNVRILDSLGCEIFDTVSVDIFDPADPMASKDTFVCIGSSLKLSATNGVTYSWEPTENMNGARTDSPEVAPVATTTYTVTITDTNNCKASDEVNVTVQPLPNVQLTEDQAIYNNEPATIVASGARKYYWKPVVQIADSSANSIVVLPQDTTIYFVRGVDQFGCENWDTTTVFVSERPEVHIPNAFTPNGDGKNDFFIIKSNESFTLRSLKIFNRWGKMVFETTDSSVGWNGRYKGTEQPMGVYVYSLIGIDELGNIVKRKGNLHLIR